MPPDTDALVGRGCPGGFVDHDGILTDFPLETRRGTGVVGQLAIVGVLALEAATEIAAERGYEGTSINLVSAKCGLPASSIYWHFKDKDDLIAAVIERSFGTWLTGWEVPEGDDAQERFVGMARQIAKGLVESPDFLRLGLMLSLERRPVEPRAREMYMRVRDDAHARVRAAIGEFAPELDDAGVRALATYAIAGADGLFIAMEIDGDSMDVGALFEMHARAVYGTAVRLIDEAKRS
jgi:AcrR family transcriptional regulator